jgi:peptidoglycan/xylan/chitin deacetylase (PgdA/CDA1 family)
MKTIVVPVAVCIVTLCLASCSCFKAPRNPAAAAGPSARAPIPPGPFAWPEGKRAAVSLSFDDARASQLDAGVPLLDAYGVKATFYVSITPMQQRASEWQAVMKTGHEIGNHSMRHPCTGNFPFSKDKALEEYTFPQMAAELDQANAEIERLLNMRPVTFAYPCGQKFVGRGTETRSYVPAVAARFLAGRGWRDEGANDPAFCDLAQLMTMELDGLTWEQFKALIDQAAAKGFWLVLCGHDVRDEGRQTTRVDTLRAFCEYAQDPKNGLWVDTVANVARYVAARRAVAAQR